MKGYISILPLLQVAFVVLKLCDIIKWSWVWVISPVWISISLCCLSILLIFAYGKLAGMYFKKFQPEKWQKMQDIANRKTNTPQPSKWQQRLTEMKNRTN